MNDDLDETVEQLLAIIDKHRAARPAGAQRDRRSGAARCYTSPAALAVGTAALPPSTEHHGAHATTR